MTNKEIIEALEEEMRTFPSVIKEKTYERDANAIVFHTEAVELVVVWSDLLIRIKGSSTTICAIKTARLSEVAVGKHENSWYLHIYLKSQSEDFFDIRIA